MLGDLFSAGANILGGILGRKSSSDNAAKQAALQKEFAQKGIQWKVADAKAAGIHPLYALGANTISYSPQTVGDPLPSALANMGQDVSRAVNSTRSQTDRLGAVSKTMQDLSLTRLGLENELLSAQIAKIRASQNPPMPMPGDRYLIDGQGETNTGVQDTPLKRIPGVAGQPQSEPGAIADVGYARTATGWAPVPSQDVKQRIEDNLIQEVLWAIRNNIMPTIGVNRSPPPQSAPEGYTWKFNSLKQEYYLSKKGALEKHFDKNYR